MVGRVPTETPEARQLVRERLEGLQFPFGDHSAQVAWCRRMVAVGMLVRDAITEKLMTGQRVSMIAQRVGISELRVFHYLSRAPDEESSPADPWRFVRVDDDDG